MTMATTSHGKLQNKGIITREDFDSGPISVDQIIPGLYLGNLAAATHMETVKTYNISHILTIDSVPLPKHILEAPFLTTKYIHISDMPKEDILHHLDDAIDFISKALDKKGVVLVHCYFGVSRSSTAVIAFVMKQQNLDYQQAFELVKSKRRFVQPNSGFIFQLKLYYRMGCKIDAQYQKYKLYCLRLAGDQLRKAKILPHKFNHLIKADPYVTQENPEPIGYRCKKCRRILVSKSQVLPHKRKTSTINKADTVQPSTNNTKDSKTKLSQPTRLLEKISTQIQTITISSMDQATNDNEIKNQNDNYNNETLNICEGMIFVEPIAWMKTVLHNTQGRLNCPKCDQKLGSFSWINGCACPCGEIVSPAFYFIPSKVELSKAIQNVQITV